MCFLLKAKTKYWLVIYNSSFQEPTTILIWKVMNYYIFDPKKSIAKNINFFFIKGNRVYFNFIFRSSMKTWIQINDSKQSLEFANFMGNIQNGKFTFPNSRWLRNDVESK